MLCKFTKEWWENNYDAFWNALEYVRRTFTYLCPFNKDVADYLLKNNRYRQYSLNIIISTENSILSLIDFISEVKISSMLKFKKIRPFSNITDINAYKLLLDVFCQRKGLKMNKIKINSNNLFEDSKQDIHKVNQISNVTESTCINYFNHWQVYHI